MATRQDRINRAKEIIEFYPAAGKNLVNKYLRAEYGVGLRSEAILEIKRQVAQERPQLLYELYARGGIPKGYREIYKGWLEAGFLPFEAREFTVGHGDRYKSFDSRAVFDSETGRSARRFRSELIRQQLAQGWTRRQIIDNIIDFYRKGRKVDPWEHIRSEYKPRVKVKIKDYQEARRRRAKAKQRRLLRRNR